MKKAEIARLDSELDHYRVQSVTLRAENTRLREALKEVGYAGFSVNDALTGLPVQHQLRDFITRHLSSGTEVVILFLDLNQGAQPYDIGRNGDAMLSSNIDHGIQPQ